MYDQSVENPFTPEGEVTLVTGASGGLGAQFARVTADAGARVVLGARRTDRLQSVEAGRSERGATVLAIPLDFTSQDSIKRCLDTAEQEMGRVMVLINNGGIPDSRYCLNVDEESWDFVMGTNLKGAWRLAREVAQRCIKAERSGSIVNIASILGLRVGFGESTYATAKAALIQLTRAMALELGSKSIRVNALCSGYFPTEMNADYLASEAGNSMLEKSALQRAGELSGLDGPLLLLATSAGNFMKGAAVPVDGGHLVSSL